MDFLLKLHGSKRTIAVVAKHKIHHKPQESNGTSYEAKKYTGNSILVTQVHDSIYKEYTTTSHYVNVIKRFSFEVFLKAV